MQYRIESKTIEDYGTYYETKLKLFNMKTGSEENVIDDTGAYVSEDFSFIEEFKAYNCKIMLFWYKVSDKGTRYRVIEKTHVGTKFMYKIENPKKDTYYIDKKDANGFEMNYNVGDIIFIDENSYGKYLIQVGDIIHPSFLENITLWEKIKKWILN